MDGYVGQQFVGIDLHRRRTVIVRTDARGQVLETARIINDVEHLTDVIARAGEAPEVVLEATYGWYWAVEALQGAGAQVHLAHPFGVKSDVRDATDLADLLRMGRLPEAWIAPPAVRDLRELVRHRGKLVALRSHAKAQIHAVLVHAVLAKRGIAVAMSDLFGLAGQDLLTRARRDGRLSGPHGARFTSLLRVIDLLDFEIDLFAGLVRGRLAPDPRYAAVQTIPGIGPTLGAVFIAEIGDVHRFPNADKLCCWAGLTPTHRESDTHVHRGRITKQGSRLVRWAAVEPVQILPKTSHIGGIRQHRRPPRPQHRHRRGRPPPTALRSSAEQAPAPRPCGRYAVALRASLDPDATSACPHRREEAPKHSHRQP